MKKLFYESDLEKLNEFQTFLDSDAISTIIKVPNISPLQPPLPMPQCFPCLCVVNDEDYGRAIQKIRTYFTSLDKDKQAACSSCGDTNSVDFLFCWSCDKPVDESCNA